MPSKYLKFASKIKFDGTPSERQKLFLTDEHKYIAYGGARGGGKSWSIREKTKLLAIQYPGIRMLLLRRTLGELYENHTIPLVHDLNGIATYRDSEKCFNFVNGSRLKLGYCDIETDVEHYQGNEYDVIFMDEGTQFTEYQFRCLSACVRGGSPNHPKRMYVTCNPGGVGHEWVKRLFIDKSYTEDENPADYSFIPAKVYDNDYLMKNNPEYLKTLKSLPLELREAWLNGEWDTFVGKYFTEFSKENHVIEPFPISKDYRRYYVNDYGLDALAGLWIAVSPDETAYVYKEVFNGKDAENSVGLTVSEAAKLIKTLEGSDKPDLRIAPPDLWSRQKDSGKSVIEIFSDNGIYFAKSDNSRIAGWMALREWLKVGYKPDGTPFTKLKIFSNCVNLIRCLPLMQFDKKDGNDAAKEPHKISHLPDALRYWAISRPCSAVINEPEPQFPFQSMQDDYDSIHHGDEIYDGEVTDDYLMGDWN
jgi:phage terminase large subunit